MKKNDKGRIYLRAIYVGKRKEIKREAQQIAVQKDEFYGWIVEPENGRAYAYSTISELRKNWKKEK